MKLDKVLELKVGETITFAWGRGRTRLEAKGTLVFDPSKEGNVNVRVTRITHQGESEHTKIGEEIVVNWTQVQKKE